MDIELDGHGLGVKCLVEGHKAIFVKFPTY